MTQPRQVLAGSTVLITRRIAHRQLLLTPSGEINIIFLYCIARAAQVSGVQVHGFVVLGNHIHLVCTDPEAKLPKFMHWLFEFSAKCLNVIYGRWENVWSSEQPSVVVLDSEEDVWDRLLYVAVNPLEAGLVETAREYPGLVTLPSHYTRGPIEARRPEFFFRKDGPTPPVVPLELTPPPCCSHLTTKEFVAELRTRLEAREESIRRRKAQEGKTFMGAGRVLAQDPLEYPKSLEPRRNLCPRIGAKNKWRRIERIQALKTFAVDHAMAMAEYVRGNLDVVFPAGTYAARVNLQVKCAPG